MGQHIARTYDGTVMLESQYQTKGPHSFRKWYTCQLCGLDRPEDRMVDEKYCDECWEEGIV
jgi:hypothetical protein